MNIFRALSLKLGSVYTWAKAHKFMAAFAAILVLGGGYYTYATATSTDGETLYSVGQVSKKTIVESISASGQVSSSNELSVTADVSGDLIAVNVKAGQKVGAGAVLARVDSADAYRTLRDAQTNLETALLSLEKVKAPASGLTLTQAQNALASADDSKRTADDNLEKVYLSANGDVVSAFLEVPDMIVSLENILTGTDANRSQWNMDFYKNAMQQFTDKAEAYRNDAYQKFTKTEAAYDSAYGQYQTLGTSVSPLQTETMLAKTQTMLENFADAVKSADAFIRLYKTTMEGQQREVGVPATNAIATLGDLNTKVTAHLTAISGDSSALTSGKQSVVSATRSIAEKQQSLVDVQDGADTLDIRSAELTVQQRENAVADAQAALADYTIRAPFGGTVATVAATRGQRVSNGGAIATIVTDRQIATLSLNEVDATKIALGDKATLTFDAVEDLSQTGTVDEIDTVGTVTQGVVSYSVKISFDSQDPRIKPGMTVNASIQTDVKTDVLSVPSSAVKTQNGESYVLMFTPPLQIADGMQATASGVEPERVPVTTGITDDTNIEIVSGLSEGQQVVTRTVTGAAAASTATSRTTTGTTRAGGPPGAAVRF
ncbi:MAG: efflux RND transporter periplasmic adaptor subunit [Candidatus Pacebacteria bacterium]|nr:efflux RND transporter periplasmic adaptor subunit [Candidatus Paceibacterota bacterium]